MGGIRRVATQAVRVAATAGGGGGRAGGRRVVFRQMEDYAPMAGATRKFTRRDDENTRNNFVRANGPGVAIPGQIVVFPTTPELSEDELLLISMLTEQVGFVSRNSAPGDAELINRDLHLFQQLSLDDSALDYFNLMAGGVNSILDLHLGRITSLAQDHLMGQLLARAGLPHGPDSASGWTQPSRTSRLAAGVSQALMREVSEELGRLSVDDVTAARPVVSALATMPDANLPAMRNSVPIPSNPAEVSRLAGMISGVRKLVAETTVGDVIVKGVPLVAKGAALASSAVAVKEGFDKGGASGAMVAAGREVAGTVASGAAAGGALQLAVVFGVGASGLGLVGGAAVIVAAGVGGEMAAKAAYDQLGRTDAAQSVGRALNQPMEDTGQAAIVIGSSI